MNIGVGQGEVVLLAGRSGKPTLIKCINGLVPHRYEEVYEGEVKVNGLSVPEAKLSQVSRIVGTIMQKVGKQPTYSASEYRPSRRRSTRCFCQLR